MGRTGRGEMPVLHLGGTRRTVAHPAKECLCDEGMQLHIMRMNHSNIGVRPSIP